MPDYQKEIMTANGCEFHKTIVKSGIHSFSGIIGAISYTKQRQIKKMFYPDFQGIIYGHWETFGTLSFDVVPEDPSNTDGQFDLEIHVFSLSHEIYIKEFKGIYLQDENGKTITFRDIKPHVVYSFLCQSISKWISEYEPRS